MKSTSDLQVNTRKCGRAHPARSLFRIFKDKVMHNYYFKMIYEILSLLVTVFCELKHENGETKIGGNEKGLKAKRMITREVIRRQEIKRKWKNIQE
jgi:hypothetical protein